MSKADDGLRRILRDHLPQFHWQSIESGLVEAGIPDANYCGDGSEGWIECKRARHWEIDLRPEQVAWLTRRARHGGRVLVAVRRRPVAGPRTEKADELWLLRGAFAREMLDYGLRGFVPLGMEGRWGPWRGNGALLGRWQGGPARWDWPAIGRVLRTA